jgi:hypothetical protein
VSSTESPTWRCLSVLVVEGRRIDGGSGIRWWIRRLLIIDFVVMSVMFLVGTPFLPALERHRWGGVTSAIGGTCFLAQFVLSFGLGLALIRRPEFRVGAALLVTIVPLIGLGLALGAFGSDFAHPRGTRASTARDFPHRANDSAELPLRRHILCTEPQMHFGLRPVDSIAVGQAAARYGARAMPA